jgi:hypothetical protein
MQVITFVNDKKSFNESLKVSCNRWHSLAIAKTIDRDGGVGSMKKLGGRGHRFDGHFWNEKGT